MEVWEPQAIRWVFVLLGLLILIVVCIVLFIWCCIRRMLLSKEYNVLVETLGTDHEVDMKSEVQPSVDIDVTGR